jgi:hypothetical protein
LPAKDKLHDIAKRSLIKYGWIIEAEQYRLILGERNLWIDLRIKHPLTQNVLLIEIKDLTNTESEVDATAKALGKYLLYQLALEFMSVNIPIAMMIPIKSHTKVIQSIMGQRLLARFGIPIVIFNPEKEEVEQWLL